MTQDDAGKLGLGFIAGWLMGRRGRRWNGVSTLLIFFGLFALCTAVMTVFVGVPLSVREAVATRGLPLIAASDLDTLAPGTRGLFVVQIPQDAPVDALGLVASRVETRPLTRPDGSQPLESDWQTAQVELHTLEVIVPGDGRGQTIALQVAPDTVRRDAQQLADQQEAQELRHSGYLPGQTVTVDGTWSGSGLITAGTISTAAPETYVQQATFLPANLLVGGLVCGGLAVLMLVLGGILRFVGG